MTFPSQKLTYVTIECFLSKVNYQQYHICRCEVDHVLRK
jgi:hypothetical protein